MTRPPVLRDAIMGALQDHGPLTAKQISLHIYGETKINAPGVRKAIWFMVDIGFLTCDKSVPRNHVYTLTDTAPIRQTIRSAKEFKVPPQLRGPVLSPLAWSIRHLLGAAC